MHQGSGQMMVATAQLMVMRIGGQPAELKSKSMFIVKEGERVIAAGSSKNGVLKIGAAKNMSAGTTFESPTTSMYFLGGLMTLLGLPTSLFIIGLPVLGFGVYFLWLGYHGGKCNEAMFAAAASAGPLKDQANYPAPRSQDSMSRQ